MEAKKLRIVYMGTPDFAVEPLRRLVDEGYNVVGVVTMPDKPAGRGLKLQQSAVKQYAQSVGLHILQPEKLKEQAFVEQFAALEADLAIVIAFRMLPEVIWAQPRLGTFNLHASLLPQYRGAAPINRAIMNGETCSGVTTFMLNHEIDKGDMLGRVEVEIAPDESAGTLHDKLMWAGTQLVVDTVERIATDNAEPIEQSAVEEGELKSAPKIFKEDCMIDWTLPAATIYNHIRGLSPYPTAWSEMVSVDSGEKIVVKIYAAHIESCDCDALAPGTLVTDSKTYVGVACGDAKLISIDELQMAGKRRMKIDEFLRGFKAIDAYRF